MKAKDFRPRLDYKSYDSLLKDRLASIVTTMDSKSDEYIRNQDYLHNFNRGSEITGQSRERYLINLAMKHITSVMDMIDDLDNGVQWSEEIISEKMGDIINYMILLEMCFKNRNSVTEQSFINPKNIL